MSICQLIYQELESLKGGEVVDIHDLNAYRYDALMTEIHEKIRRLKTLEKVVSVLPNYLEIIDDYWRINIDVGNLQLKDCIATKIEDIRDTTVFYIGRLNYGEYQKIYPFSTSLPPTLKLIAGSFVADHTNIESYDIDLLVGWAEIQSCNELQNLSLKAIIDGSIEVESCEKLISAEIGNCGDVTIKQCDGLEILNVGDAYRSISVLNCWGLKKTNIGNAERIEINSCHDLISANLGNATNNMTIGNCSKLQLDNVSSIYGPDYKIKVGNNLVVRYSNWAKYQDEKILAKFEANTANIIRE